MALDSGSGVVSASSDLPARPRSGLNLALPLPRTTLGGVTPTLTIIDSRVVPACTAVPAPVPTWLAPQTASALAELGITELWSHQATALELLHAGRDVIVATGTASGKSLIYQASLADAVAVDDRATGIYLAPTKALGHDQARAMRWTGARIGVLDGDTDVAEREWIRAHAHIVITNPDLLHVSLLPRHQRWRRVLRHLALIVVDECHLYRGVFGSHVALVLRRLLRLAARAGAEPLVLLSSATTGDPELTGALLSGRVCESVTADGSPRGQLTIDLGLPDEGVNPRRVAAQLLAESVRVGQRTLAFVPSRTGAEWVALEASRGVTDPDSVMAYRSGLLAEERRAIEAQLRAGTLLGVATTSALEVGMDISGVDRVIICGWPGRRSSFWQQVGRAGRNGEDAAAVLIAAEDPLDHYVLDHPGVLLDEPVEASVLDPANPAILRRHLIAAAAEAPLDASDADVFPATAATVIEELVVTGVLRRRPRGVFWPEARPPAATADIRSADGVAIQIVAADTGRILGTIEATAALRTVHEGAVYVHQGEHFLVTELRLADHVALVLPTDDHVFTMAMSQTWVDIDQIDDERSLGFGHLRRGQVHVETEVHGYQRRRAGTGEVLSSHMLELPTQVLSTTGVWWSWPDHVVALGGGDPAGSAHAAEHAAIGLLPLVAPCDRWDVGGLSTAHHPATGECTVFVYDGYPGGVGYTHRGYVAAAQWLGATARLLANCPCTAGCPRCVQSPKCGNGNSPLDKVGAAGLLAALVS